MRGSYIYDLPSVDWHLMASPLFRGVVSDIFITFLIALVCTVISRVRFAALLLCALYAFMLAANAEFIFANDANLDFMMVGQALDASFIDGAVFTNSMAIHMLQAWGVFALSFWLVHHIKNFVLRPLLSAGIAISSLSFLMATPVKDEFQAWLQMNAIEDNVITLRYTLFNEKFDIHEVSHFPAGFVERFFTRDLDGIPIVPYPKMKPNVLIVALESVGAQHLIDSKMPYLKSLEAKSLYYPNYAVSSQVTVNGLYAIHCADSPGFMRPSVGSVKAWKLNKKQGKLFCLPNLLEKNGYHTVFIQSATLEFQRLSKIMPMMGFHETFGRNELDPNDKTAWGPDDKRLYQHALEKIESLQNEPNPWFMTIMTISTHYPTVVPDYFFIMRNGKKASPAHLYADLSLEYFISELKKRSILENTVVIITNDEVRGGGGGVNGDVDKNNGVLMVLTPDHDKAEIDEPFIQTDIFLSVADYLGLDTQEIPLGRSIFRKYATFRPLFFNNFFSKKFFVALTPGTLLVCKGKAHECDTYQEPAGKLFKGDWQKTTQLKQWRWLIESISKKNDFKIPQKWEDSKAAHHPAAK